MNGLTKEEYISPMAQRDGGESLEVMKLSLVSSGHIINSLNFELLPH